MQPFETVSFHIVKPCNMACKFCYATFEDIRKHPQLSFKDARVIIDKLKAGGVQKITFAGGEPLIYAHLSPAIMYTSLIGLTTSIITNGSLLTPDWLEAHSNYLDWIGISIDSLDPAINTAIGRVGKPTPQYGWLTTAIRAYGYKLKINTVVNAFNHHEDMNHFITLANPARWKVFQALRVEGQNDKEFDAVKVTANQFNAFLMRHAGQPALVPEDNEAMTGSYLLIDPTGRLFENSAGRHTYSDSLVTHSLGHCLEQLNLSRERFIQRGGVYEW